MDVSGFPRNFACAHAPSVELRREGCLCNYRTNDVKQCCHAQWSAADSVSWQWGVSLTALGSNEPPVRTSCTPDI